MMCQLCGKLDHTVQRCYHQFDIHFEGPNTTEETPHANNQTLSHAYMSEAQSMETTSSDWFIDSGATNHLANNLQQLRDLVDYNGEAKVTVMDNLSLLKALVTNL